MKYYFLISFISLAIISQSSCERDGKFIAALVSFPSDQCNADNDIGVCFSKKKCTRMGGKNLGSCAHGYGQCCKFTAQCNANEDSVIVTRNLTTLATPTVLPKTCTFSFQRQPGVCQLRLDFPKLNLNDAMVNGDCVNDSMSIIGSVTVKELNICGIGASAANHMYLDYGSSDNIQIRLRTLGMIAGMSISMYGYEIRVTQIKCNSAKRVPQDCLQYYTERTGVVTSYNYPKQQLNNENYRVCIEKQSAGDRIEWRLCNGTNLPTSPYVNPNNMCLEGDGCGDGPSAPGPPGPPGAPASNTCALDYIEIPGGMPNTRYCRNPFPAVVTSENFWMLVHFDATERQDLAPLIPDSALPCSDYTGTKLPDEYNLVDTDTGGCSFQPRSVDKLNTGFCLAYTVL